MSRYLAIIVAGGSGSRMGSAVPKQFLPLGGRPVLMRTVEVFASVPGMRVVVVLPAAQMEAWATLCREYDFKAEVEVVAGGSSRFESVSHGVAVWKGEGVVGVHDGVRPLITADFISHLYSDAELYGSAIPVLPSVESVRMIDEGGVSHAVERSKVVMVQTPQVFRSDLLVGAYAQPWSPLFTDDASVVEATGHEVHLSEGLRGNIKLTTPEDMRSAEALLASRE